MSESDFIPAPYSGDMPSGGSYTWAAPSNIALVKYWGKHGFQIPENPSISFTLDQCRTTTTVRYNKNDKSGTDFQFDVYLDGLPALDFRPKIDQFFKRVEPYLPFLRDYRFVIETSNSFPHSSGIASSASGMSALSLCLLSLERELNPDLTDDFFNRKASFVSRLGSGSACRSIEGPVVIWGQHEGVEGSSALYGIPYPHEVHEVFKGYRDTILLVDQGEKEVSSTVGHKLMYDHPFAESRFKQAYSNITKLKDILRSGDLDAFVALVEGEALALHAMMMTSSPYFILMKPNTLTIIKKIWQFRNETGSKLCFTLDAGANVHVLYPDAERDQVMAFITSELSALCQDGKYIEDQAGNGARQLNQG